MPTYPVAPMARVPFLRGLGLPGHHARIILRRRRRPTADAARRHRWRSWVKCHITSMGLSYILLLTAFYVDNGHSLTL